MLRDAFIEGCMSDPLRDKLIMTDRLTLSQLEELAAAHDRGLQRKALLQGTVGSQSPAPVEVAFAGRRNSAPARRTPQKQLAARLYHQNFSSVQLRPAGPLSQWNGSGINVLGKMTVTVRGSDSGEVLADIYVAVGQLPLMGRDLQQQLALTVRHGNVVCQVCTVS
ncbi:hypothetical protein FJT64_021803 [Amphibalanus amphitrite]|uniref:Uncharacterized protein n=1 Tax=Amphibalanus amphitrite TaxID=1232801 RepID=A0A6A4WKY7_AMPAM|nr:hypothetical protein FJT64_021803 [Amphibalanus amphitrite]